MRISVEELAKRITFSRRKFRGFTTQETDACTTVTADAPIIDDVMPTTAITDRSRPESWNAKMPISGKPLITDEQFDRLLANAPKSIKEMKFHEPKPVVKIFLPHIRWLLVWGYPDDLDRFFCVIKFGRRKPEAGNVRLSDIVKARLGNIVKPGRDLYIKLDKPWAHYLRSDSSW